MAYADRTPSVHSDGSLLFEKQKDTASENAVRPILEARWNMKLHHYPRLFPIDWYASRDERPVGLVEIKTRDIPVGKYTTVFLNYRKWHHLSFGSMCLCIPSLFVVRFQDALRWIDISMVDPRRHRIAGCREIVKADSDREIVIDVPISDMHNIPLGAK